MSKSAKKWLIAAASLVAIGAILFAAVMTAYHWKFSRLSTVTYETNTYEISQKFSDIQMSTDTADVLFAVSDDDTCKVACCEAENVKHSVRVQDGTLSINSEDNREWYDYIGINVNSLKITVYLPDTEYKSLVMEGSTGDIELPQAFVFDRAEISLSSGYVNCSSSVRGLLKIETSTGDICVNNASIGDLDITVSTGEVSVSDTVCNHISSGGSTGDVFLKNVNAAGKISIERSTGNVRFDNSDAAELFVKTGTGDVSGGLLTEKVFVAETSTGHISVPQSGAGGTCEIITSTGDILFR